MTQGMSTDFHACITKRNAASALCAGKFPLGARSLPGRKPQREETMQEEATPHAEVTCSLHTDSFSILVHVQRPSTGRILSCSGKIGL